MPLRLRTTQGLQTLRRAHHFLVSREYSFALGELALHVAALPALVSRLPHHTVEQDNIWCGGLDRSQESPAMFYDLVGPANTPRIRLAVMDRWKAFRTNTEQHAPAAVIRYDNFHVLRQLNNPMDRVRKAEYERRAHRSDRQYVRRQT